jgi:hypothetical protein
MAHALRRFAAASVSACAACAHAGLDVPNLNSFVGSIQSGIGVISGFHCTASRIQVYIDRFPPLDAGLRTERNDTAAVCGGRVDTGFSLLFNYNTLSPGAHRIEVLADGYPFAAGTFQVVHFGLEYMTGKQMGVGVRNFPGLGDVTTLSWDEEKQNFSITRFDRRPLTPAQAYGGTFYGALLKRINNPFGCGPVPPTGPPPVPGTFEVAVAGEQVMLTSQLADGSSCTASGPMTASYEGFNSPEWSRNSGVIFARMSASSCPDFNGIAVALDGERIFATDGFNGVCLNRGIRAAR